MASPDENTDIERLRDRYRYATMAYELALDQLKWAVYVSNEAATLCNRLKSELIDLKEII